MAISASASPPKAHTPGPWKRGDCDSWIIWAPRYAATEWVSEGATLGEPEAVVVSVVEARAWMMGGIDPDEREAWLAEIDATANLISAAPDMLEALKAAKDAIRAWHGSNAWEIYDRSSPEMKAINAAIAKAEGRP